MYFVITSVLFNDYGYFQKSKIFHFLYFIVIVFNVKVLSVFVGSVLFNSTQPGQKQFMGPTLLLHTHMRDLTRTCVVLCAFLHMHGLPWWLRW